MNAVIHPDFDQTALSGGLDDVGFSVMPSLLSRSACHDFIDMYAERDRFRAHIDMQRYGFGQGEYRYFAYPLPPMLETLRQTLYTALVPTANTWRERMGLAADLPDTLTAYLARCHDAGQTRPTPLLLRYGTCDYNRLHQDLYGDLQFPIQVAVLLNRPGIDFDGGEFVLTEQKPRAQSRPHVVPLKQGDAAIIPVRERPRQGKQGFHRVQMRHGVSEVRSGIRRTLGIIFHDAK